MTRAARIHYLRRVGDETARSLCDREPKAWHVTRTRDEVTCKLCKRELAIAGCAPEEVCGTAPAFVPHEVDPMRGTSSPSGHDGFGEPWKRVDWPSLDVALLTYWTIRRDEYPSKSVTEMLETYAMLGDRVDGGGSKEPRALRMADSIADIELAAREAFAPAAWVGDVTGSQAWAIVLVRAGTQLALSEIAERMGLPRWTAHGAVGKGRARLHAEMQRRGMLRAKTNAPRRMEVP